MAPGQCMKVAGVRIVRRSGHTRQSFATANANRASAGARPVIVSTPDDNFEASLPPSDGRLRVSTERPLKGEIPLTFDTTTWSEDNFQNPVAWQGGLLEDQVPVLTVNDLMSLIAAIGKRCDKDTTGDDMTKSAFTEAMSIIQEIPDNLWDEWTENEDDVAKWMSKFSPEKRARMLAAEKEIPFASVKDLRKKDLSVKLEVLLKRDDPEWAPRVIYAGSDVFNRVTGPAMQAAMERLVQLLADRPIGVVEVKLCYKTDDIRVVDFLCDDRVVHTYEGDFSANDREQRESVHILFDAWLGKLCMPEWLRVLFIASNEFEIYNRKYGVKGSVKHQLPTGTTATTCRNSVYNLTMFAVSCARQKISVAKAAVLGDDILARTREKFSVVEWKRVVDDEFKMKLKGSEPHLHGQATLLSQRLVIDTDLPCMIPKIGKALARFNVRASFNPSITDAQYMTGKALSYAYAFRRSRLMRDAFLERAHLGGMDTGDDGISDAGQLARSLGMTLKDMVASLQDESHYCIPDHDFENWLYDTYELFTNELGELLDLTVLNPVREYVTHPSVMQLAIDW